MIASGIYRRARYWHCGILLLLFGNYASGYAQESQGVDLDYFRIIVIPYREGEKKITTLLEENPNLRKAISQVESSLIELGFNVEDFTARLDAYLQTNSIKDGVGAQAFISFAKPDIYCTLEIEDAACEAGKHRARILLKSYFSSSGRLLGSYTEKSNCFVAQAELSDLVKRAIAKLDEDFKSQLRNGLDRLAKKGQSLDLSLVIAEDAPFSFSSGISAGGTGTLRGVISAWLEHTAESDVSFFRVTTTTEREIRYDNVRLPFYRSEAKTWIYQISTFQEKLSNYLNSLEADSVKVGSSLTQTNGIVVVRLFAKEG